jgi:hypothetical protein
MALHERGLVFKGTFPMVFIRLRDGIAQHFTVRLSEWLMLFPTVGMWAALKVQTEMFTVSPSFVHLASWASESTWAAIIFVCGIARMAALIVNGTFDEFRFSPHVRCAAAVTCALFWSQFSLGFFYAYWSHGGALSAFVAYTAFTIFELANVYRSSRDVGTTYAETKRRQRENDRVGL